MIDELSVDNIKLAKVRLNCYLNINAHLDIVKYLKITRHIFESVELRLLEAEILSQVWLLHAKSTISILYI